MTREQKKTVRKALRRCGRRACEAYAPGWGEVVAQTLAYYDGTDPVCAELLRLRYLDGLSENAVLARLYIGRTTYYRKELEALSTVAIAAARRGLL